LQLGVVWDPFDRLLRWDHSSLLVLSKTILSFSFFWLPT